MIVPVRFIMNNDILLYFTGTLTRIRARESKKIKKKIKNQERGIRVPRRTIIILITHFNTSKKKKKKY